MTDNPHNPEVCRAWSTDKFKELGEFLAELERLFKSGDPFIASPASLEIYTHKENADV
jgi:hypothetical protein